MTTYVWKYLVLINLFILFKKNCVNTIYFVCYILYYCILPNVQSTGGI
jgi:hypothetical protein